MQIAPLERLNVSDPDLNGSRGLNRAPVNPLEPVVGTDLEAAKKYLYMHRAKPTTQRNYTKEIERLILWAINVKQKAMSSLTADDMAEFLDFLANPQPVDVWAAKRKYPRESPDWRPFVSIETPQKAGGAIISAGLGTSSRLTAHAGLSAFLTWLVDYGYLVRNPLRQLKKLRKEIRAEAPKEEHAKVDRYLDEEMWAAFQEAIERLPKQSETERAAYERARFISALMFYLSPRPNELANGLMNHFFKERGRWWWKVVGKGDKAGRVPAIKGMLNALVRYRTFLGLTPLPLDDDASPLLRHVRNVAATSVDKVELPLTARQLNYILDDLFETAAQILEVKAAEQSDPLECAEYMTRASKIRKSSAHWGRHTSITFQINSGVDPKVVQRNARHSTMQTTEGYMHDDEEHWFKEAEKLKE